MLHPSIDQRQLVACLRRGDLHRRYSMEAIKRLLSTQVRLRLASPRCFGIQGVIGREHTLQSKSSRRIVGRGPCASQVRISRKHSWCHMSLVQVSMVTTITIWSGIRGPWSWNKTNPRSKYIEKVVFNLPSNVGFKRVHSISLSIPMKSHTFRHSYCCLVWGSKWNIWKTLSTTGSEARNIPLAKLNALSTLPLDKVVSCSS